MKKFPLLRILISVIIYLILIVLCSTCGLIHPACYAYIGTIFPLFLSFVYLWVASRMQYFGAAAILNVLVLGIGLIAGEGNQAFIIGMLVLAGSAELLRLFCGYKTLSGIKWSFIPLAYSFYSYAFHWWTEPEDSLAEALEMFGQDYVDKMSAVISNTPVLVLMLLLVIPVAIYSMKLAQKVMKKQISEMED